MDRGRSSNERKTLRLRPARQQTSLPLKAHPRNVELPDDRTLPPAAGAPRAIPTRWGLYRRRWWSVFIYLFILIVAAAVAGVSLTSYAFSRYQGLILPGVFVANQPVGDQTWTQAQSVVLEDLSAFNDVPIVFAFGRHHWQPTVHQLQLTYDVNTTIDNAFSIGRSGSFFQQLFDRLPVRRHFTLPLIAHLNRARARAWVLRTLVPRIHQRMSNAGLRISGDRISLIRSHAGYHVNEVSATGDIVRSVGSLSLHRTFVPLTLLQPQISDSTAASVASRINAFLASPPRIRVGHQVIDTSASVLAGMISFTPKISGSSGTILMTINTTALSSYVGGIANTYYRAPTEPNYQYNGNQVTVLRRGVDGRSAMVGSGQVVADPTQTALYAKLLQAFQSLSTHRMIRAPVLPVKPPLQLSNPASLGINALLGEGETTFAGSPNQRIADIQAIANTLDGDLIKPGDEISFNYYAGSGWPSRVYVDHPRSIGGNLVPSVGGAMQQVATTFFRAGYEAGLPVVERHPHTYRLPWYEPPVAEDATVLPNVKDLRFTNTTGGYLLIQTRVEPVQQSIYIYIYGHKTDWSVSLSPAKLLRRYRHGPAVTKPDPALPIGVRKQSQFALDGADYQIVRTITFKGHGTHSHVTTDTLDTHYAPEPAVFLVGTHSAKGSTHKPKTTPTPTAIPTATPTASLTPTASPTATATGTPTAVPTRGSVR